jgi:adenylate cyclase
MATKGDLARSGTTVLMGRDLYVACPYDRLGSHAERLTWSKSVSTTSDSRHRLRRRGFLSRAITGLLRRSKLMHSAVCEATMWSMTDDKVKRRLTTVLCADVHGYSRLMGADEAGTLGTLRRYRSAIAGLVERHDGRIVNTWGDAVIAEFASVVEAVQCAVEIQQEISNQDSDQPRTHQMRFRIGINLGDVMVDGSDIFGDGVNIAARLQELAEPGGVVVSASVYDLVHNKLSLGFDYLGQQPMKNVGPVISYRVTMGDRAAGRHSLPVDESPTPQVGAVATSEAGARRIRGPYEPSTWMSSISNHLANLPRPIAAILTVSGFLILINVFTGLHRLWFHWPVAALLFIAILRTLRRHRSGSDRNEEGRRSRD